MGDSSSNSCSSIEIPRKKKREVIAEDDPSSGDSEGQYDGEKSPRNRRNGNKTKKTGKRNDAAKEKIKIGTKRKKNAEPAKKSCKKISPRSETPPPRKILQPLTKLDCLRKKLEVGGFTKYTIGKRLGSGAYGLVARAVCEETKEPMACKIIYKKSLSKLYEKKFLPREIELIAELRHPNIVRHFETIEVDRYVLFFMELCDRDLSDLLADGPLQENVAKDYFKQITSALQYLHSRSIAHRDIKPENVLLTAGDEIAKLSDFGLARKADGFYTRTFCGTLHFAPPEIHYSEEYDPLLVDCWSMGALLFAMLTAEAPFAFPPSGYTKENFEKSHLNPIWKKLKIKAAAMNLIRRLLAVDPEDRLSAEDISTMPWMKRKS